MTQHIKDTCQDSMSVDRPGGGGAGGGGGAISGNEMDYVWIAGNTAEGGLIYKDIVKYEYRCELLEEHSMLQLRNLVSPIRERLPCRPYIRRTVGNFTVHTGSHAGPSDAGTIDTRRAVGAGGNLRARGDIRHQEDGKTVLGCILCVHEDHVGTEVGGAATRVGEGEEAAVPSGRLVGGERGKCVRML